MQPTTIYENYCSHNAFCNIIISAAVESVLRTLSLVECVCLVRAFVTSDIKNLWYASNSNPYLYLILVWNIFGRSFCCCWCGARSHTFPLHALFVRRDETLRSSQRITCTQINDEFCCVECLFCECCVTGVFRIFTWPERINGEWIHCLRRGI